MLANGMKQRTADRPLVAALACRTTCRWAASWPILERMTIHQNAESFSHEEPSPSNTQALSFRESGCRSLAQDSPSLPFALILPATLPVHKHS